ncbi:hypothetical protein WJX73_003205 [Symbiochloris irregularis]|uniref:UDP-galactose transporter n=1 Tax=Symbiochloris irregularis TaxID=706552 RepID=A0AAW1PCJ4_9CHLO
MHDLKRRLDASPRLHVAICVAGIMGSLLLYSILQERIMTIPFGASRERYQSSLFLVLSNRLVSSLTALICLVVSRQTFAPTAPLYSYAAVSLSNVVATTCQYEALKYVSFPVQTLGKCAKMIPVMIWGSIIMRRSYKPKDYTQAAIITLGATLFLMSGSVSSKASKTTSSLWGLALMLTYLGFDGFTSTFQDKLFTGFKMSVFNQMLYTNLFSAGISFTGLMGSGQLRSALLFQMRHPDAMFYILLLSLSATLGQLFIIYTIRTFGALTFATAMTTRQFVSILLSCLIFLHPLSMGQWVGTAMVFGALFHKIFGRKGAPAAKGAPHESSRLMA